MQPTFFPWAGYFRQIAFVESFIFLDDAQLARQSWQTRNRILISGAVHWIPLHIKHGGLDRTLTETYLDPNTRWKKKLVKSLSQAYSRHPFSKDLNDLVGYFSELGDLSIADLNISIVNFCLNRLEIKTCIARSSQLLPETPGEQRTERLLALCRRVGCTSYLSPVGAAEYLGDDGFERQTEIKLEFSDWKPPGYRQHGIDEYVSHLSVADVIANLGWVGAREYILADWPQE